MITYDFDSKSELKVILLYRYLTLLALFRNCMNEAKAISKF